MRKAVVELPNGAIYDEKNHPFFQRLFTPKFNDETVDLVPFTFAALPPELRDMTYEMYRRSGNGLLYSMMSVQLGIVRSLKHLPPSWTPDQYKQTNYYRDLKDLRFMFWMNGRYLSTNGYPIAGDSLPPAADITGLEVVLDDIGVQRLTVFCGRERKSVVFDGTAGDTGLWYAYFPIAKGDFVGLLGISDVCASFPSIHLWNPLIVS